VTSAGRWAPRAALLAAGLALGALPAGAAGGTSAAIVSDSSAQAARAAGAAALDSLVASERAFSALSVAKGMKEAFLAWLADDGIVFRPAPVNGLRLWRERTSPSGTLIWEPDFAELSGAGDIGVTSGPWEYRAPPGRDAPTAHGHFVSVWSRARGGPWRVAADIGVDHEKPAHGLGEVALTPGPYHAPPPPQPREFASLGYGFGLLSGSGLGFGFATGPGYIPRADRLRARAINGMMNAERGIPFTARTKGIARAYADHADPSVRVFRDGTLPIVGLGEALPTVSRRAGRLELLPLGDGMAGSFDLGYSYGLLIRRPTAAPADTSAYLHVWRRDAAGRWKLAVDVENAFPKGK
jgi:ketosteroid isomerase-like protein